MADISKIQTNGNTYDVKDATARENLDGLATNMDAIRNMAQEAQETADTAQSTAESKVSSVNIGSVTTGDSPSVTNSGTDKDVTLDFVFPSGGGGSGFTIKTFTSNTDEFSKGGVEGTRIAIDGEPVALLNAWTDDGDYCIVSAQKIENGYAIVRTYTDTGFTGKLNVNVLYKD